MERRRCHRTKGYKFVDIVDTIGGSPKPITVTDAMLLTVLDIYFIEEKRSHSRKTHMINTIMDGSSHSLRPGKVMKTYSPNR